jgi:hypothetical protein
MLPGENNFKLSIYNYDKWNALLCHIIICTTRPKDCSIQSFVMSFWSTKTDKTLGICCESQMLNMANVW